MPKNINRSGDECSIMTEQLLWGAVVSCTELPDSTAVAHCLTSIDGVFKISRLMQTTLCPILNSSKILRSIVMYMNLRVVTPIILKITAAFRQDISSMPHTFRTISFAMILRVAGLSPMKLLAIILFMKKKSMLCILHTTDNGVMCLVPYWVCA